MSVSNEIKISIRNLVEFIMRSGDLDAHFISSSRAVLGTKAHQKIQQDTAHYTAEIPISYIFEYDSVKLVVDGRIDGVIAEEGAIVLDEIKSTEASLDKQELGSNSIHWAQAKCYAYMYAVLNNINELIVQLTYCHIETGDTRAFRQSFDIAELKIFFFSLIDQYMVWAKLSQDWIIKRDASIQETDFPYDAYRKGQREMAVAVYRTITEQKKLFVQAPTGIGKTISVLFPSIKAMGEGHTSKIFYTTAKTIARQVAENALNQLRLKGLRFKSITLTAKEKTCFKEAVACNPDTCEFAKGFFDRLNQAVMDAITHEDALTRNTIEAYAQKHKVCPFEFSLELALWVDGIICDYNYLFDPSVYLKRFFMNKKGDYCFLIDEAHNLVDRGREMFSASIYKKDFLFLKRLAKGKDERLYKTLNQINAYLIEARKKCSEGNYIVYKEAPKELLPMLKNFVQYAEAWLAKGSRTEGSKEMLELYFNVIAFLRISELYDSCYITHVEKNRNDICLKLFCLDPSHLLAEAAKRGRSTVFFSATLTPIGYFREILGGSKEDFTMRLASPFDHNNLSLLLLESVSTKYKDRESSYEKICDCIYIATQQKKGNYLVFFPSYHYMNEVFKLYEERYPEAKAILQAASMSEETREAFLEQFEENTNEALVAFAVLGGIFSEGIDLMGERLIGAMIIGVGLPQLCVERDLVAAYFNEKNNCGYEYSYMYPGMNKVLQAAGRVIRSEEDRGMILLIDDRFGRYDYQKLFPKEWQHCIRIKNSDEIERYLNRFWSKR